MVSHHHLRLAQDHPLSSQMRGAWSRAPPDDPSVFVNAKVLFQPASIPTTHSKNEYVGGTIFVYVMIDKRTFGTGLCEKRVGIMGILRTG